MKLSIVYCLFVATMAPAISHADGFDDVLQKISNYMKAHAQATTVAHSSSDSAINLPSDSPATPAAPATPTTADSSYVYSVKPNSAAVLLQVVVTMDGTPKPKYREATFIPISAVGADVTKKIYLGNGPGTYTIDTFYSADPNRYQAAAGFIYVTSSKVINTDTRDMSFLLPAGDIESDAPSIIALAQQITSGLADDAAKALAIHDWVASNVVYDTVAYFDGSYAHTVYDAVGTLNSKKAICFGYSALYAALARAAGLRAKIIDGSIIWPTEGQSWAAQGDTQMHAWNQVLVGDRWVTLDTTWDSGGTDFATHVFKPALSHKYYDPDPAMFALDHRPLYNDPDN